MSASLQTQTASERHLMGNLTRRALAMAGTGVVLSLLTFGLPLPSWWLLFQTALHTSELWQQQGVGLLAPLFILTVQVLLLLTAWILLGRLIVREMIWLFALQQQPLHQPEIPVSPQQQPLRQPDMPVVMPPPMEALPGSSRLSRAPLRQMYSYQAYEYEFEEDDPEKTMLRPEKLQELIRRSGIQEHTVRPVERRYEAPQFARARRRDYSLNGSANPVNMPQPVQKALELPAPRPTLEVDPFAVQIESLDMFKGSKAEKVPFEANKVQKQPEEPIHQTFVFGNPFEGELPDVFQHDEDLKRSLLEQNPWLASPDRSNGKTPRQ